MGSINVKRTPLFSKEKVGKIKEIVQGHINTYFSGTLGSVPDIVNIVAAQIYKESSFNTSAMPESTVSTKPGTTGFTYINSSAVQAVLKAPENSVESVVKKRSVYQGLRGMGLMQVMGWNYIKGGFPSGKGELERLRPDIAGSLMVEPGTDLISVILGEANMSRQILAGLIMLEGKYRATHEAENGTFQVGNNSKRFPSRIAGALGAYLGLGTSDSNGTTSQSYAETILGGASYKTANSGGGTILYDITNRRVTQVTQGPATNGVFRAKYKVPGCV